jgi:hypothetical protein
MCTKSSIIVTEQTEWLIDSIQISTTLEADSRTAGHQFSIFYATENFMYLPLNLIPSHFNATHIITLYLRSVLILSYPSHIGLLSDSFPSGLPTKTLHSFLILPFL